MAAVGNDSLLRRRNVLLQRHAHQFIARQRHHEITSAAGKGNSRPPHEAAAISTTVVSAVPSTARGQLRLRKHARASARTAGNDLENVTAATGAADTMAAVNIAVDIMVDTAGCLSAAAVTTDTMGTLPIAGDGIGRG